jgi:Fur family ferric uptake transcriptional regulator
MKQVPEILSDYGLRTTEQRKTVLSLFQHNDYALSYNEIEHQVNAQMDRVTLYRILRSFVEKGLLHTIPDEQQTVKYALCLHTCEPSGHHQHNHVHFTCLECKKTTCLESANVPNVVLPQGYKGTISKLVVQGTCPECIAQ